MTLTLAITTYNRVEFLRESFEQVINHSRIGEIILMDDCSSMAVFNQIKELEKLSPKIKILRQAINRGMGRNKADAISYATNDWVIIFDSDNVITPAYLDVLPLNLDQHVIYQPAFARPNFDFRKWAGKYYDEGNAPALMQDNSFNTMLNACNYVVNSLEYLKVYQENVEHKATDTVWFNYLWLKSGRRFYVVPEWISFRLKKEVYFKISWLYWII